MMSYERNWAQSYRGSSFYVKWMRGTFICDNLLSPWGQEWGWGIAMNKSRYVVLLWALGTSHVEAYWELSCLVSSNCQITQSIISSPKTGVQI